MESKDNKNAIIAVVLSGVILFGWNYFFAPQPYNTEGVQPSTSTTTSSESKLKDLSASESQQTKNSMGEAPEQAPLEKFRFELEDSFIEINNKLNVLNFSYKNAPYESLENFKRHDLVLKAIKGSNAVEPVFTFTKVEKNHYKILDTVNNISGAVKFLSPGFLEINLISTDAFTPNLSLSSDKITNEDDERRSNSFSFYGDSLDHVIIGSDDSDFAEFKFKWFGLDYNYHLLSVVVDSTRIGRIDYTPKMINYKTIKPFNEFSYKLFYAKKNYDDLHFFGNDLDKAVDFGMWAIIAVPILRGLQYFYELTHNYGLAIIIITLIMRLLTFPLQYKSFKSMKKMQVIQPDLQKIREKHSENPQKMQQETMALFKKAGANPLSGCLPMLAQMPVFFAFYQVLFTSVELVDAPFYFWIHDLSEKDPYYVLPVLMGLAMFLNMKLTPTTTADPMQQKMMMFMPVIFSLFMLNLPSGLTLYILISTLAGMAQQLFVYRQTS